LNTVIAVSLNASGQVVVGTAGQSGFVGIVILTELKYAGDIVDVMKFGEVVEFDKATNNLTAFAAAAAGTVFYANAGGAAEVAAPVAGTNKGRIGHTVENWRLIVNAGIFQG
jgi:hypothetical protein